VAETIKHAAPLGIVVGVVKLVGTASRPIALDSNHNIGNVVASRACLLSDHWLGIAHPGDYIFDRLVAFDLTAAIIEYAILAERGDVEIRIVEIRREEMTSLQIFNGGTVLCVAGKGLVQKRWPVWLRSKRLHR